MSTLSVEEIRERLHLKASDDHIVQMSQTLVTEWDAEFAAECLVNQRRFGRTTETLVRAVQAAQTSNVWLVGHSWWFANVIHKQAIEICQRIGVEIKGFLQSTIKLNSGSLEVKSATENSYGIEESKIFKDHTSHSRLTIPGETVYLKEVSQQAYLLYVLDLLLRRRWLGATINKLIFMLLKEHEAQITSTNSSLKVELKYKTVEDIRQALGLMQPCDHIVKVVKELLDNDRLFTYEKADWIKNCRGFGATTEVLLKALFAAQQYKVCLEGFNPQKSELLAVRARKMAVELGINPENILAAPLKLETGTVVCGITTYYDRFRNL